MTHSREPTHGLSGDALMRVEMLRLFEAYRAAQEGSLWRSITQFSLLWQLGQVPAPPHLLGAFPTLPAKSLDKWYRAWRNDGAAALARRQRKDAGHTGLDADPELARAFDAALAQVRGPAAPQVRRLLAEQLGEEATPPLRTISRWLRDRRTEPPSTSAQLPDENYPREVGCGNHKPAASVAVQTDLFW